MLEATRSLDVLEVIVIHFRNAQAFVTDTHAVVHHQCRELAAVDEHDAATSANRGLARIFAEVAGRDENAFGRPLQFRAPMNP